MDFKWNFMRVVAQSTYLCSAIEMLLESERSGLAGFDPLLNKYKLVERKNLETRFIHSIAIFSVQPIKAKTMQSSPRREANISMSEWYPLEMYSYTLICYKIMSDDDCSF